jgi:hypothetical protein
LRERTQSKDLRFLDHQPHPVPHNLHEVQPMSLKAIVTSAADTKDDALSSLTCLRISALISFEKKGKN